MLQLINIVKNYPTATTTVQALKGVNLTFRESEFVAILGPSGCGKSTMLNIIGGLDRYTEGDLRIGGVSTKTFDDLHWDAYRNATIGFVFQSYNLIPHLTVLENVEIALSLAGVNRKTRRAKAVAALHRVGMGDEINKRPNQLSGGQMQRVAIARALVTNPKIILADEPTGALDSELSVQVMDLLKEISETCLVIMVTHNAELAHDYCDRICRFKDGQLISDSHPYEEPVEEKEEELQLGFGDIASVTTDTSSLQNEPVKPEIEHKEQTDEVDYSTLYQGENDNWEPEKVSNRKRKKSMKSLSPKDKASLEKLGVNSLSKKKKTAENKKDKSFKPTSMSAGMAFGLSIKNLISKKGRTAFTAFACSIGIIGLGLVLSIRTGFNGFVDNMQSEMMAGMPLGVYEYNVKVEMIERMMNVLETLDHDKDAYPEGDGITIIEEGAGASDSPINKLLSAFLGDNVDTNHITSKFDEDLRNGLAKDGIGYKAISSFYGLRYNLIADAVDKEGNHFFKDVSKHPPVSDVMSIAMTIFGQKGLQADYWEMLVGDEKTMMESYEFIGANSRYPQAPNELLLCVSSSNKIEQELLDAFGINMYETDANGDIVIEDGKAKEIAAVTADDFIGKSFRLIDNDSYYAPVKKGESEYNFNKFTREGTNNAWYYKDSEQDIMREMYQNSETELKIVGVIRQREGAGANYVANALCYLPELQAETLESAYNSEIASAQRVLEQKYIENGTMFCDTVDGNMLKDDTLDGSGGNVLAIMSAKNELSSFLRAIGAEKIPSYINIYPGTYENKEAIMGWIERWNKTNETDKNDAEVNALDMVEMIISNLHMVLNIASTLLIAVAAISLVVSTAMVGVITANSVVERIREIGILRALGARKRDIRNVFVAETSLLGLGSGLLGIIITYILTPIISIIIKFVLDVPNLLVFNPLHALALVVLSLVLTVISGVAPAIMASRKNVVDALRVE